MFTLEQTSNEVKFLVIYVNTELLHKQIFKVETEPGQSDGSGSSQIPRLRNPVLLYCLHGPMLLKKKKSAQFSLAYVLMLPNMLTESEASSTTVKLSEKFE